MSQKNYADSDFFLALIKDSDWLKEKAKDFYEENKENIWITPFTVAELMIIFNREGIHIKEAMHQISRIAKIDYISWELFFESIHFMENGATIFDSLLMALCGDNKIVSSDNVYKNFGFEVIDLKD